MTDGELCRFLEWDSAFFGRRIARVVGTRLTNDSARSVCAWSEANAIECLYFLAASDDPIATRAAEDHGFRFVDVRLTLGRGVPSESLGVGSGPGSVRPFERGDLETLRACARQNHTDSRFYFDPKFPAPLCDALYETWIEKSCNGYADAVLVAEAGGLPAGYVTCDLNSEGEGQIGLVGVDPGHRGLGLGRALVGGALGWFAERGATRVRVVTQARNVGAQRLYEKSGFLVESVEIWYHRWFSG